jgi:hypothetical protein
MGSVLLTHIPNPSSNATSPMDVWQDTWDSGYKGSTLVRKPRHAPRRFILGERRFDRREAIGDNRVKLRCL